jgi:hypothetical protein
MSPARRGFGPADAINIEYARGDHADPAATFTIVGQRQLRLRAAATSKASASSSGTRYAAG